MKTAMKNHESLGDSVIREVRATKERLARLYDFDVKRIAAAARAGQQHSGHEVVSLATR